LVALRRRHVSTRALTGLALAVAVGVELLGLTLFLDWWLELPWGLRCFCLTAQVAWLGYWLGVHVVQPLVRQPDDDELALMVERAQPEFRGRLIASIQLTQAGALPPGASAGMVDALVEETEAMAERADFSRIVSTDKLRKLGALAAFVLALGGFGLSYGRPTTTDLLQRAFLFQTPVPRKTRLTVPHGNMVIGRGDTVLLEAYARGVLPARGRVVVKQPGRRAQAFALEATSTNRAHFVRAIENVQATFSYWMVVHDARSETYSVRVLPRPTVATIECEQEYPAYTRLKPARRALGDLSVLAGSVLRLRITATQPVTNAALRLVGPDTRSVLTIDPQDARRLSGQFAVPATNLAGFSVELVDTECMASRDSAVYRVDIIPDRVPSVRLTHPERNEELATPQATLLIGMEVADDFALARVRLRYREEGTEGNEVQTMDLDLGSERPARLKRRFEWKLHALAPPPRLGTRLEYWIEAEDNNAATGPGVGASERRFAKIVTEAEKRADLLNRAGDYLGSIQDVATDQERLNLSLGELIREKALGR
jgi:hypothetical protein